MLFERTTSYTGRAILHRPQLDLLPVYVRHAADVKSMMSILDLSDNEIQNYLDRNERMLLRVVRENDVSAMHVNHVVLMSVVARRVSLATGVPYAVMPDGTSCSQGRSRAPGRGHRRECRRRPQAQWVVSYRAARGSRRELRLGTHRQ